MVAPNVSFAMVLSKAWRVLRDASGVRRLFDYDKVLLDAIGSGKGL
jgi:hypothetical protein